MQEQLIVRKIANALVQEAEMSVEPALAMAMGRHEASVEGVVSWFRRFQGGLWVGGTATLTTHRLLFEANSLNKMVHAGPMEVEVQLRHVIDVNVRRGFVTSIVQLLLPGAVFQVRCWGAKGFAEQIRAARAAL